MMGIIGIMNRILLGIYWCLLKLKPSSLKDRYRQGRNCLHLASLVNSGFFLRQFVEMGADLNLKDEEGNTPLYYWAFHGDQETTEFLLFKGANPNVKNNKNMTPLHAAVQGGNLHIIPILIKYGAKVNEPGLEGWTPLHLAVSKGDWKITRELLQQGADPNFPDPEGLTPLHLAVIVGNKEIASLLLDYQASPHLLTKQGKSLKALDRHRILPEIFHDSKPNFKEGS